MNATRHAVAPTVGIVGAGQLARMTYQAAIPLGLRVRLLAEHPEDAAARISPDVIIGSPTSTSALTAFAADCDVVTFDHELVDTAGLTALEAAGHQVRPAAATVAIAQDKRRQRAVFAAHGFPVPPHRSVADVDDLLAFADEHGWPIVAKAIRGGYDGRGVWELADPAAAHDLLAHADAAGIGLLVETRVPIEREIAVLVARRPGGDAIAYPPVETVQRGGICRELLAPAPLPPPLAVEAQSLALAVARAVDAVGIVALELFVAGGALVVNEIAARPHNSGHWTIEGCATSQFEQHLRAVLDWPLGAVDLLAPAVATVNLLGSADGGDPLARLPAALACPGAHVHLYGKAPRPGRKLGHVTALGPTLPEARRRAREAAALLVGPVPAAVPS